MRLIEDWQNKNLRCWFCGTTMSVKYSVVYRESGIKPMNICVCNKCAPYYALREAKEEK